jgi:hypothetical protein
MANIPDREKIEQQLREMFEKIHPGKDHALPRAELCTIFREYDDRHLRRIIKHLIIKHGCPIGSCSHGYFWAVTQEEIEGVCNYFKGYALSQLQVISKLKKIPMGEVLNQLSFEEITSPLRESLKEQNDLNGLRKAGL